MMVKAIYGNLLKSPSTPGDHSCSANYCLAQGVGIYILIYAEMSSLINNALHQRP